MSLAECPEWTTLEELTLAEAWGDARLRVLGRSPHGEHQIIKRGSISVVWRQQTETGQDVFLKVVPPLFAPEPPLTEWLSRRWPANVPPVLATDRHRRWMLTRVAVAQRLSPLYHAGSYRRIFGIGTAAVAEFAQVLPWLLGLLIETSPR